MREIGATKYVELSWLSGRGVNVLVHEIAYAGLGKLVDEEKERKRTIEEKLQQRRIRESQDRQRTIKELNVIAWEK